MYVATRSSRALPYAMALLGFMLASVSGELTGESCLTNIQFIAKNNKYIVSLSLECIPSLQFAFVAYFRTLVSFLIIYTAAVSTRIYTRRT